MGLQNKVQSILARAKAWVVGLAHRLEPQARCVAQHVRPLAAKLATELHAEAAAYARAFWSELGPSLGTLSLADRHTVVDAPWSTFAAAVGARFGEARQSGHHTIGGWFGRARNRDEARAVFDATFDADAARLSAELKQGYDAAMR